ncbi:MAG: DegT/DnrJ/EryC1/StrS family aminotransferase [Clostridiales bacterium]|nr:DegT/DnrJ/EryC1/StrS family aminotransferase [Clostridiales bacterium]
MSKLAILGGSPIGSVMSPKWPIWSQLEIDMVTDVVKSGEWGTNGPRQVEFEEKFSEYCSCKYGVMMTNGTHTLKLAMEALGIGPGDEVIVPGSTWQATASSVLDVNAVPILVDITPDTYTIDPASIKAAITSKTRAIIPVHIYGRVCDMDAVMHIAKKHDLWVIEDAAHQHGSEWRGKKVGTIGNIGSFSLQLSKILNTGEGGVCLTNEKLLYDRMYSLKFCGRETYPGSPQMQSGNFRCNEFAAAIGIAQLTRLTEQNKLRHENALYLEDKLSKVDGIGILRRDERVTFQAYYQLPLQYKQEQWNGIHRNKFIKAVRAELNGSFSFSTPYTPLNNSELYSPFSKKTHKLSEEYCKAIDPSRFSMPVVERAYKDEYIGIFQHHLLAGKYELDKLVDAVVKVRENIDELATVE